MNDAASADPTGAHPELVVLPTTFVAFQELHGQAYFRYAEAALGDTDLAQDVVDDVFGSIVVRWDHVLTQPNPATYCWRLLRHVVEYECGRLHEHLALVERVAFMVALRDKIEPMLDELSDSVAELEDGMTLGAAIRALPGAKFDAIVLKYLVGLADEEIADVMGIEPVTVRSLISQARTRLEAQLGPRRIIRPAAGRPRKAKDGRTAAKHDEE